jgi:hypothetical protein
VRTLTYIRPPYHAVVTERADPILFTQSWICDKPWFVTVITGANVTEARSEIPPDGPNGNQTKITLEKPFLPILKENFLTLTLGQDSLKIRVIVANIKNEFILVLDKLRTYRASMDLGRQTLLLAEQEVLLWGPGAGPRPSSLVVASDQVVSAQYEGVLMARFQAPRSGKWSGRTESGSPSARRALHSQYPDPGLPEGTHDGLNATHRHQKLTN